MIDINSTSTLVRLSNIKGMGITFIVHSYLNFFEPQIGLTGTPTPGQSGVNGN